jgi:hypothetical protein
MKRPLVVMVCAVALFVAPLVQGWCAEPRSTIPTDQLAVMGLAGMTPVTDEEGAKVRGTGVIVTGSGWAGVHTSNYTNVGATTASGSGASQANTYTHTWHLLGISLYVGWGASQAGGSTGSATNLPVTTGT